MEHLAILWDTVAVARGARDFELTVRLDGEPSHEWEQLFNGAAEKEGLSPQGRGWSHLRVGEGTISMRELKPEARDEARRYLDDIVARTNDVLAARLEEAEQERLRIEQEEAELHRQAEELTAWFRSAGGPAPRPAPAAAKPRGEAPEPASEEQADRGDLRDRLLHAFGSDAAA